MSIAKTIKSFTLPAGANTSGDVRGLGSAAPIEGIKAMRTKEEKQAYARRLRDNWKAAKKLLTDDKISEIQAIIKTHGMKISVTGYMCVAMQMRGQELAGIPYLDAKTYKGWKENGFQVKKGEKSTLSGITWIGVSKKEPIENAEEKPGYCFPKAYHLFHRTQVDAIGAVAIKAVA